MKNVFYLLFLMSIGFIQAQEVEKTFVPYYLEDGEVKNFERVSAKNESRAIGFGYGGVNTYLTIFDNKYSNVRFEKGNMPTFIIKTDPGVDVFELVLITKADVVKKRKKYRRFVQKGYAMGGQKDMSEYITVPTFKKIGEDLYEMVFEQELEPGDYAFAPIIKGTEAQNIMSTSGDMRIYCFGIGPDGY